MFDFMRWVQQGVSLYLDNAARYFQPIAPQIRIPVWLLVSLTAILACSTIAAEMSSYKSIVWSVTTIGVACIFVWIGFRVVFKYPPDDWGNTA